METQNIKQTKLFKADMAHIKKHKKIPLDRLLVPNFQPVDPTKKDEPYIVLGLRNHLGCWVVKPDPKGLRSCSKWFCRSRKLKKGDYFFFPYYTTTQELKVALAILNEIKLFPNDSERRPEIGFEIDFNFKTSEKVIDWLCNLFSSRVFQFNVSQNEVAHPDVEYKKPIDFDTD